MPKFSFCPPSRATFCIAHLPSKWFHMVKTAQMIMLNGTILFIEFFFWTTFSAWAFLGLPSHLFVVLSCFCVAVVSRCVFGPICLISSVAGYFPHEMALLFCLQLCFFLVTTIFPLWLHPHTSYFVTSSLSVCSFDALVTCKVC